MPDFIYATSEVERVAGNYPHLVVENMFVEEVPTETRPSLQSRPGLKETGLVMGGGPVEQLFKVDGVLDNALFGVSAGRLYSNATNLGFIDGTFFPSIAGYEEFVFVNAGRNLWGYDGTTLAQITFPDDAYVAKIVVGASRLVCIRKDTGTFYWSEVLEATIDPLNFATAENSPDSLLDMLFLGDRLILFGSKTVEFWPVSDDEDLPFQPLPGYVFQCGIKETGCATVYGNTFAWINDRNEICLTQPDNVISGVDLQVKLENSLEARLWTFNLEGTQYLAATLQNEDESWETHVFRKGTWSVFTTKNEVNWLGRCFDGNVFGSSVDGRILEWDTEYTEVDDELERRFTAWLPIDSGLTSIFSFTLRTNQGHTPYITGDYTDPVVELRISKDGGNEWSDWRQKTMGRQGKYRHLIRWLGLGSFSYPGVLVEIRISDPVPFRVSGLEMNGPFGGI